jgi:hypothetical protein
MPPWISNRSSCNSGAEDICYPKLSATVPNRPASSYSLGHHSGRSDTSRPHASISICGTDRRVRTGVRLAAQLRPCRCSCRGCEHNEEACRRAQACVAGQKCSGRQRTLHHLVVLPLLVAVQAVCEARRNVILFQLLSEGLDALLNSTRRERLLYNLYNIKCQLRHSACSETGDGGHPQQQQASHYTNILQLCVRKQLPHDTPPSEQG